MAGMAGALTANDIDNLARVLFVAAGGAVPQVLTRCRGSAAFGSVPSAPREAIEVERGVRTRSRALRLPYHFAQALDDRVQRIVRVCTRSAQPLELRDDAGRLVDRELLGHRQMRATGAGTD